MEAVEGLDMALEVDESVRSVAQLASGEEVRANVCVCTAHERWPWQSMVAGGP